MHLQLQHHDGDDDGVTPSLNASSLLLPIPTSLLFKELPLHEGRHRSR
jgi:hypothetical protein